MKTIPIKIQKKNKIPIFFSGKKWRRCIGNRVWRKSGNDWDEIRDVAYSPNGDYIVVVSYIADAVELMNTSDGSRVWRKSGSDWDGACGVAYSPNGDYIVVVSYDVDAVELID